MIDEPEYSYRAGYKLAVERQVLLISFITNVFVLHSDLFLGTCSVFVARILRQFRISFMHSTCLAIVSFITEKVCSRLNRPCSHHVCYMYRPIAAVLFICIAN
jgi:hypothetical protein